ncbi:Rieske 2Fe-2S domain-containing protein [Pendulispora albinea]|uniref:Rieske 2Fe-2S domain-containing protein n=1 Tax=Pendulispora albinea TaxID=2741071 RepID=A0ABZ2LXK9_9BACT
MIVARVPRAELSEGALLRIPYPPYDVLLTLIEGKPYAVEDACNHSGASLAEGWLEGHGIVCPMHGYIFDMRNGALVAPRGVCDAQRTFRAVIEGDEVAVYDDFSLTITGLGAR